MLSPTHDALTPAERRAGIGLASIFALRMLGLFLILPVFSVYAKELPSGKNVALIGLAIGFISLIGLALPASSFSQRSSTKL